MIRITLPIILFLFLVGCKQSRCQEKDMVKDLRSHQFAGSDSTCLLNPDLKTYILEYINNIEENDSIYDVSYILEFINDSNSWGFDATDSCIIISFYQCCLELGGYQGVATINDYKIIVLDKYEIGRNFYNEPFLERIPVDSLSCTNENIRPIRIFRIKGDEWAEVKAMGETFVHKTPSREGL